MLLALHHDVDSDVVVAGSGLGVKERGQKLRGDDDLQQQSAAWHAAQSKRPTSRRDQACHKHSSGCCAAYRLGGAGLTAGSHKLLKHKALILVVHTLAIPV